MDADSLKESLEGYEAQLQQINNTLKITLQGEEYSTLVSLRADMMLLIDMTKESLQVITGPTPAHTNQDIKEQSKSTELTVDDEYALFMAEMAGMGAFDKKVSEAEFTKVLSESVPGGEEKKTNGEEITETDNNVDIEEELSSLQGMKCSVLYSHRWGGAASLHNAMVCSVEKDAQLASYDDIKVKVLFTNPTHVEMVPCPYYLDGECRFTDEQCRYSHGEVVSLSSLSEATEPNFNLLKSGCRVLAKIIQLNEASSSRTQDKYVIWHRAVVKAVDKEALSCTVKLEHASSSVDELHVIPFANIFPLTDIADDDTDTESSLSDLEQPSTSSKYNTEKGVTVSLSQNHGTVMLGDWEKYTRGIGSKLMHSMGWVSGSGLGANSEGRLLPVQCQITPLGKSLDHCMELKEGRDPDKIAKKLKRLQKKRDEREKQAYERERDKERHNVFNVLNSVLSNSGQASSSGGESKNKTSCDIKSKSCKGLNIEQFKLSEDETRLNREIEKLRGSLNRNNSSQNSAVYKSLSAQLSQKCSELDDVKLKQKSVTKEQANRKSTSKMTVF